ncbi:MAG: ABC transporter ATP-binding protein [Halobacteriota archaeon]
MRLLGKERSSETQGPGRVQVDGVDCYYLQTQALNSAYLTVQPGEVIGLVGPNGSGKTTLLKAISGVLRPQVGIITLDDVDVYRIKPKRLAQQMAVVPQSTDTFFFDFTVEEVVLMGRSPHINFLGTESTHDFDVVQKALEMTDVARFADRKINELSGGEQQRVIIARALAQEPKILLLDEATSQLDIGIKIEIFDLVRRLAASGIAVIAAIHDLNLAAQYCDRLLLLKRGEIIADGTVEEVLTQEHIAEAFGVSAFVRKHPITNAFSITLLPRHTPGERSSAKVHVIPGGGKGAPVIHALVQRGLSVSAGVVNTLDTDYEVAQYFSIECAVEAPFSPISSEVHSRNLQLIQEAAIVVLPNICFGPANLKNLEAAELAADKLVIVEETPIESRDFTHGVAQRIYGDLRSNSPVFAELTTLLAYVESHIG